MKRSSFVNKVTAIACALVLGNAIDIELVRLRLRRQGVGDMAPPLPTIQVAADDGSGGVEVALGMNRLPKRLIDCCWMTRDQPEADRHGVGAGIQMAMAHAADVSGEMAGQRQIGRHAAGPSSARCSAPPAAQSWRGFLRQPPEGGMDLEIDQLAGTRALCQPAAHLSQRYGMDGDRFPCDPAASTGLPQIDGADQGDDLAGQTC